MFLRIKIQQHFIAVLGLAVAMIAFADVGKSADWPCASEQEKWNEEFIKLKQGVEEFGLSKQQPLTSRIEEEISRPDRTSSIAETVQEILRDRSQRIESAHLKCRELSAQETIAFNSLMRCTSPDSRKRNHPLAGQAIAASRDRDALLRDFNNLLLDEAYVQYKNQQPLPQFDYSGGYGQRSAGSQDWGTTGQFQRGGNRQGGFSPYGGFGR